MGTSLNGYWATSLQFFSVARLAPFLSLLGALEADAALCVPPPTTCHCLLVESSLWRALLETKEQKETELHLLGHSWTTTGPSTTVVLAQWPLFPVCSGTISSPCSSHLLFLGIKNGTFNKWSSFAPPGVNCVTSNTRGWSRMGRDVEHVPWKATASPIASAAQPVFKESRWSLPFTVRRSHLWRSDPVSSFKNTEVCPEPSFCFEMQYA